MIYSAVARMARLAILLLPATPAPSLAAETPPQRPYSCRLYHRMNGGGLRRPGDERDYGERGRGQSAPVGILCIPTLG